MILKMRLWQSLWWTLGIVIISEWFLVRGDSVPTHNMSNKERNELKEETREMFYHAYNAYMDNAYPADELMPLSCKGRIRGVSPSRGDLDDVLGNFSMTLVDSLDTLVLLNDFEEFEHAVKLVIENVQFDSDIIVSVFETNIRMIGGLLSAHILAEYIQKEAGYMPWYRGELLEMAKDLGYRLLPAFNTSTGIPHARVNLRHGMKVEELRQSRETCTACAGTILLEFAALSRLSGEPIFEQKAHASMDALWKLRNRGSDLMGTVLNVHSGDWVRRDSGVGAGIDSYYEYCLKSYVLLGEGKYLARFNRHYSAVMKYISQGPMLLDVHMHRPHAKSRNFMDALLAFWPGLQVLSGDLKPAVQTHEMLYQVMQMHTFIPEAFTFDFQIHWGQHPLRPEFIESTYFLYKATGDHYYLQVAKKVLQTLQKHARVECGFAAVNDVRTGKHEDRMDSFVLSETIKYLFLIFADPSELILDLDNFIFTTEAHLLPLSLGQLTNATSDIIDQDDHVAMDFMRSCPSPNKLFPETVRRPLRDLVTGVCPRISNSKRLRALDFQSSNADHIRTVYDMGISMVSLGDGKVQLMHSFYNAKSPEDAEKGLLFMQEMLEISKSQTVNQLTELQAVFFSTDNDESIEIIMAGPSHFSPELIGEKSIQQKIVYANPLKLCSELKNANEVNGRIVIVERGECTFVDKARKAQAAKAVAVIVIDNVIGSTSTDSPMFAMSGDGISDVTIPVVFVFQKDAEVLHAAIKNNTDLEVLRKLHQKRQNDGVPITGRLDATGNIARQIKDKTPILYHALTVNVTVAYDESSTAIPITEQYNTLNTSKEIADWLFDLLASYNREYDDDPLMLDYMMSDFSFANFHAVLLVFNRMTLAKYFLKCYKWVYEKLKNGKFSDDFDEYTKLKMCFTHLMHTFGDMAKRVIGKKENNSQLPESRIILEILAAIIKSNSYQEILALWNGLSTLLSNEYESEATRNPESSSTTTTTGKKCRLKMSITSKRSFCQ